MVRLLHFGKEDEGKKQMSTTLSKGNVVFLNLLTHHNSSLHNLNIYVVLDPQRGILSPLVVPRRGNQGGSRGRMNDGRMSLGFHHLRQRQ